MAGIRWVASTTLPTRYGLFNMAVYEGPNNKEQVVLTVGAVANGEPVLVRLHSECLTGDLFGSERCDCGEQLDHSLRALQASGHGVLIYLRQEGRGIGLANKIRAYHLQEQGFDTVDANRQLGLPDDSRDYADAAEILRDLGVARVRLMTNNPAKIEGIEAFGIKVVERVPVHIEPNPVNAHYIRTKQERMGHFRPTELSLGLD